MEKNWSLIIPMLNHELNITSKAAIDPASKLTSSDAHERVQAFLSLRIANKRPDLIKKTFTEFLADKDQELRQEAIIAASDSSLNFIEALVQYISTDQTSDDTTIRIAGMALVHIERPELFTQCLSSKTISKSFIERLTDALVLMSLFEDTSFIDNLYEKMPSGNLTIVKNRLAEMPAANAALLEEKEEELQFLAQNVYPDDPNYAENMDAEQIVSAEWGNQYFRDSAQFDAKLNFEKRPFENVEPTYVFEHYGMRYLYKDLNNRNVAALALEATQSKDELFRRVGYSNLIMLQTRTASAALVNMIFNDLIAMRELLMLDLRSYYNQGGFLKS